MAHGCRQHCPSRSGLPWLFDLLAGLAALATLYWLAGRVAAPVSAAVGSLVPVVLVTVGVAACAGLAACVVVAARNRRTLARFAAIEREAWAEPTGTEPAALPPRSRELEAAPIRVEAFRVEAERDVA